MTTPTNTTSVDTTSVDTTTIATEIGPLSLLVSHDTVVGAGFTEPHELWERLPTAGSELRYRPDLGEIGRLVNSYLDGELEALDRIPVHQPGTDLQHEVWDGLRAIPAGQTRTYTELAAMTSNPRAIRAAGTACGRNLLAPMVPCHRALRSDGSLGGYYYGLNVKRWLLAHEEKYAK